MNRGAWGWDEKSSEVKGVAPSPRPVAPSPPECHTGCAEVAGIKWPYYAMALTAPRRRAYSHPNPALGGPDL
jgi:hypothetical protein